MSENEKGTEQPDKIVDIVEKILGFNERYQEGQGLKILTPDQMLSRLPSTLAQLYRSKKLTKTIYNNLINTI